LHTENPQEFHEGIKEHLEEEIKKFEPLQFEGEFLNQYTQLLGPRKSPHARRNNIQMSDNGYYVLTPLKTKHGIVLVNRGWIHEDQRDLIDAPDGKVSIVGVMREAEYPSYIHPDKFYYKGIWFINDPAKIFQRLGIKDTPILVDLTMCDYDTTLETKQPEDYVVFTTMPATHFSYLVTWYSLCAWCFFGAYAFKSKQMRQLLAKRKTVSQGDKSTLSQAAGSVLRGANFADSSTMEHQGDHGVESRGAISRSISEPGQSNASQRKQQMQSILKTFQMSAVERHKKESNSTTTPLSSSHSSQSDNIQENSPATSSGISSNKPNEQP